jgi:hypothetical protein
MPHFAHCPGDIVRKVERIESAVMLDPDGQTTRSVSQPRTRVASTPG